MRKITLILTLLVNLATITTAQNFTLNGTVLNSKSGAVLLYEEILEMNVGSPLRLISETKVNDQGKFEIKGMVDTPILGKLVYMDEQVTKNYRFFLESGVIKLVIDKKRIEDETEEFSSFENISGTKNNNILYTYAQLASTLYKDHNNSEIIALKQRIKTLENAEVFDYQKIKLLRDELSTKSERYIKALIDAKKNIYAKNKDCLASEYLIIQEGYNITNTNHFSEVEKDNILSNVSKSAKSIGLARALRKHLAYERLQTGMFAPNFSLKNQDGEIVSLSDFKGKLVLIDFWAYYCAPCIAAFPSLNKLYTTYKDQGFEIISISADTKKEKWDNALNKHRNPWIQLIDQPIVDEKGLNKVAYNKYVVEALPTYYLIDPDGNIIIKGPLPESMIAEKVVEFYSK